jgi:hypothetical protein
MPMGPERLFPSFQDSGESQRHCKVGSGSFRKIREIVVLTGPSRADLGPGRDRSSP